MYIYKILNKLNNKAYIGITSNIQGRFVYHKTRYNKTNKKEFVEKPLYRAFRKYGIDNFEFIILFSDISYEEAKQKEVELIAELKTLTHENGYNITKGGDCRSNYGANNNTAILVEEEVIDIRNRVMNGENIKNIFNDYKGKVTYSGLRAICNGKTWKYLGDIKPVLPNGASINKETVLLIRSMFKEGINPRQIAIKLNLDYKKCWRICKGNTYKNICTCVETIPFVGE